MKLALPLLSIPLLLSVGPAHAAPGAGADAARLYQAHCALCHGAKLEGAAGPSLADKTWLHGQPTRARLVIFRMPVEERVRSAREREELLSTVLTALVANYLNLDPEDIDPRFSW